MTDSSYDFTIRMNGEDWSINENGGHMWIDEVVEDHTTSLFIVINDNVDLRLCCYWW